MPTYPPTGFDLRRLRGFMKPLPPDTPDTHAETLPCLLQAAGLPFNGDVTAVTRKLQERNIYFVAGREAPGQQASVLSFLLYHSFFLLLFTCPQHVGPYDVSDDDFSLFFILRLVFSHPSAEHDRLCVRSTDIRYDTSCEEVRRILYFVCVLSGCRRCTSRKEYDMAIYLLHRILMDVGKKQAPPSPFRLESNIIQPAR